MNHYLRKGPEMAITRQFDGPPLQVVCLPSTRARIEKIADDEGVSMASVIRDALEECGGLDERERRSRALLAERSDA